MQVRKCRVILTSENNNDYYRNVIVCDVTIFEKTDGNYTELITKVNDKTETTTEISSGAVVYQNSVCDEGFNVYPNMTLDAYYLTLNIPNYTLTYSEALTVI